MGLSDFLGYFHSSLSVHGLRTDAGESSTFVLGYGDLVGLLLIKY